MLSPYAQRIGRTHIVILNSVEMNSLHVAFERWVRNDRLESLTAFIIIVEMDDTEQASASI
jgi:hypothetical protein